MAASNDLGDLGEQLVARWLQQQGWTLCDRRWRCRWGELDVVVFKPELRGPEDAQVLFVEVKTRSPDNWDADGRLAIAPAKQRKLWRTAQAFLNTRPDLADCVCRFDVALVGSQQLAGAAATVPTGAIALGQPVAWGNVRLTLLDYLPAAISA